MPGNAGLWIQHEKSPLRPLTQIGSSTLVRFNFSPDFRRKPVLPGSRLVWPVEERIRRSGHQRSLVEVFLQSRLVYRGGSLLKMTDHSRWWIETATRLHSQMSLVLHKRNHRAIYSTQVHGMHGNPAQHFAGPTWDDDLVQQ